MNVKSSLTKEWIQHYCTGSNSECVDLILVITASPHHNNRICFSLFFKIVLHVIQIINLLQGTKQYLCSQNTDVQHNYIYNLILYKQVKTLILNSAWSFARRSKITLLKMLQKLWYMACILLPGFSQRFCKSQITMCYSQICSLSFPLKGLCLKSCCIYDQC